MSKKDTKVNGSKSKRIGKSRRKLLENEEVALHRRALSMVLQQHQLSQRYDAPSMSRRIGSTSRRRTLSDPFSNSKQVSLFFFFYLQDDFL